jgi:hypothetical protein
MAKKYKKQREYKNCPDNGGGGRVPNKGFVQEKEKGLPFWWWQWWWQW